MHGQKIEAGDNGELKTETPAPSATPTDDTKTDSIELTKVVKDKLYAGISTAALTLKSLGELVEAATETETDEAAGIPEQVGKALELVLTQLADSIPDAVETVDVSKVGRKMSGARLKKLEAALTMLTALVKEVGTGDAAPEETPAVTVPEKSASEVVEAAVEKAIKAALGPVVETMESLAGSVTSQGDRVEAIEKKAKKSQQIDTEVVPTAKVEATEPEIRGIDLNGPAYPKERRF